MSNTKKSPKEMAKTRLAKNKLMKLPLHELNKPEKENLNPVVIKTIASKPLTVHDRKLNNDDLLNPYDIPNHIRMFSQRRNLRKHKRDPFIMTDPHTVCDIDETFYKIIEGRPLRQLDDIKVYMRNIRDITLFRANTAYLRDQIIQIDTNMVDELQQCNKIHDFYLECKTNFVQYAKESYNIAKQVQIVAEEKANELANMVEQLGALSFRYVKLKNEMSGIAAKLEILCKYRSFLVQLSPDPWQATHNQIKTTVLRCIKEDEEVTASSSNMFLNLYKKGLQEQLPAKLFFKRPIQMIQIFDYMSKQCLNYMQIKIFSDNILTSVMKSRDYLKMAVMAEISELQGFIGIYNGYIKWMEDKEIDFKTRFLRIIDTEFQELCSSYDNSKLYTCVQYVNTRIFKGIEDPKDSVTHLMLQLESLYLELTSGLDDLNQEVVKAAQSELFAEDIMVMKRAFNAQRSIRECDILSKSLYTSFKPPHSNQNSKK